MNKSDSERIAAVLENLGYEPCFKEEEADLIIVVACSVRQSAVDRIYGRSVRYNNLKKKKKNLKTILTGCVLADDQEKLKTRFDFIIHISEIEEFFKDLLSCDKSSGRLGPLTQPRFKCKEVELFHSQTFSDYLKIKPKRQSPFQAYIPIMTGCNNFCAYCVVPYTRGREYSRPAGDIINEAKEAIKNGYKEITLIGQNVNSYCTKIKSNGKSLNFPALLRLVDSIPGDFWIRFATSHPKDMSNELIEVISKSEKICPYIHLPIQAGSNKILKAMNRRYTNAHYLNLIKKIRKKIPEVMISTDVIVGFPGETRKDFKETEDIFKKVKYTMAYIARYSPRPGTASSYLKDNISRDEKARREKKLTDILKQTALENNKKFLGKIEMVLVEKNLVGHKKCPTKKEGNIYIGKTRQFTNVKFKSPKKLTGRFAEVKITNVDSWGMGGELILVN